MWNWKKGGVDKLAAMMAELRLSDEPADAKASTRMLLGRPETKHTPAMACGAHEYARRHGRRYFPSPLRMAGVGGIC